MRGGELAWLLEPLWVGPGPGGSWREAVRGSDRSAPRPLRRRRALEEELQKPGLTQEERDAARAELARREREFSRLQRQRLSMDDYEPLKLIGKGAFGEVGLSVGWGVRLGWADELCEMDGLVLEGGAAGIAPVLQGIF